MSWGGGRGTEGRRTMAISDKIPRIPMPVLQLATRSISQSHCCLVALRAVLRTRPNRRLQISESSLCEIGFCHFNYNFICYVCPLNQRCIKFDLSFGWYCSRKAAIISHVAPTPLGCAAIWSYLRNVYLLQNSPYRFYRLWA